MEIMEELLHKLEEIQVVNSSDHKLNVENGTSINLSLLQDLLKRSQTFLSLNLFRKSLQCSDMVLEVLPDNVLLSDVELQNLRLRGVDLKGKAQLGLGEYEECLMFLGRETKSFKNLVLKMPPHQSVNPVYKRHLQHWKYLMERGKLLQRQKVRGEIDMGAFIPNRKVRLEVDSVVEYQGPVEIGVTIKGKGRGVVALEDIPKGTLVLATRAFEIIFDTEDEDDDLENSIAQRMRLDPTLISQVYQLHAGKELGYFDPDNNNNNNNNKGIAQGVDLKRIAGICTMNSFGNSRNSSGYGHNSRGLWVRASFFNHDCIDFNCMWKVLGDFLFVRTVQDLRKGEELLISYTDTAEPFEEREKFFNAHDFSCACRLCKYQSQEALGTRRTRLEILRQLSQIDEKDRKDAPREELEKDIQSTEKFLHELELMGTNMTQPEWNFSPHVALDILTKLYLKTGDLKYKEMAMRYYVVVNCSGITTKEDLKNLDTVEDKGPCLEVGAAGQVASVFMKAGDFVGAQKWIKVLRQDLTLVYGKGNDVIKKLYPQLHAHALKNGLCVD